jgi:hypothetical protein
MHSLRAISPPLRESAMPGDAAVCHLRRNCGKQCHMDVPQEARHAGANQISPPCRANRRQCQGHGARHKAMLESHKSP